MTETDQLVQSAKAAQERARVSMNIDISIARRNLSVLAYLVNKEETFWSMKGQEAKKLSSACRMLADLVDAKLALTEQLREKE
jgi:hypothetical protein